jgi:hypothetical protein
MAYAMLISAHSLLEHKLLLMAEANAVTMTQNQSV